MTDVELPAGWRRLKLGDLERDGLLELRAGFAQGVHNEDGRGVPHLRPFNVTDDGRVDFDKIKFVEPPPDASPQWLRTGDVIFNNTNSEALAGKTALFDSDLRCVPSNHMTVLRATSEQSPDPYWLAAQLRYLWGIGVFRTLLRRYVGQATVSLTRLRDLVVSAPPLEEQRAIAHVLRTVQQAKGATEQVAAAAEVLEKSLMKHLFSHGLTELALVDPSDLVETPAGAILKHWQSLSLADLGAIGNGSTPKRSKSQYWDGGTIPWITSAKVHDGVIVRADEFVTELAKEECHLPLVPSGSVVIAISGQGKTLGNAAVVGLDTTVNQHLAYVRLNGDLVDATFLVGYLSHQYADLQAAGRAGGSTRAALTCGFLAQYPIPVPPLDQQREIAQILRGIRAKIAAEYARRDALATLFHSLLRDLVTGRLRVTDVEVSA